MTLYWTDVKPIEELDSEFAYVWGDPHFIGADGGKYDVHNQGTFSLMVTKKWYLNGLFSPVENNPDKTLISDTMMKVGGDRLFMQKTGKLIRKSFEGRSKVSPGSDILLSDGQTRVVYTRIDESAKDALDKLVIADAMYDYRSQNFLSLGHVLASVVIYTQDGYIVEQVLFKNMRNGRTRYDIAVKSPDGLSSSNLPSGLIGQSFDLDDEALSADDFNILDFETRNLNSKK